MRAAVCGLAASLAAVVWLPAQAPPATTAVFHVYLLGREIGREAVGVTVDGAVRRVESTLTYTDRGEQRTLTATLDTGLEGTPRRLTVKGDRPREGRTDFDATVTAGRVQIRDNGVAATPIETAGKPFFPLEGAAPFGLQEFLIRYWSANGRPREFAAAPAGPVRIQSRAVAQLDLAGRPVSIERLSIDGPVFGRETAWVEPGGNLLALVTWAGGVPMQAVRDGHQGRLQRFVDEAQRDRLLDADALTNQVPPEHADGVVLTGATVIVGGKKPPIPNATVVVRNGRIAEVGPSARVKPPEDLPKLDVAGMTIMAGLWDLHGQVSNVELLPVLLASGITTSTDVAPDAAFATALRASSITDRLVGPRLLAQAGFIDRATTPDEGRQLVRKLRGDGVRRIQVGHEVPANVVAAIAQEANRSAISVASWAPADRDAELTLDDGVDVLQLPLFGSPPDTALFASLVKRQRSLEPMAAWAELFASDGPAVAHHPLLARAPGGFVRRFSGLAGAREYNAAGASAALRAAQTAGVPFVVGTGEGIPGSQIQRELELYVAAGMSPADALQTVTSLAAQVMKMTDAGTVESGKRADLVILTGNPLESIGNLRTAKWVVADGKVYDCAKLLKAAGWN